MYKPIEEFLSYNKELIYLQIFASIHISLSSAYYNIGDYEHSIENIQKAIFFLSILKMKKKQLNVT